MKHEEARFILHAYRPNGADAGDPAFAEALAQARQDPGLAAWLAHLQGFDRTIAAKLAEVAPPAGLRETILAGARASQPVARAWWRQPSWMALAACLALAGVVALTLSPRQANAADLKAFAVKDAQAFHLHGEGEPWNRLQAHFAEPANRLGSRLAIDFDELRTTGCRTLTFQGREVLEVCFNRGGKWFHCYIVRRSDFPVMPAAASPQISPIGKLHAASWADDTHLFVVVSKAGREALDFLL